MTPADPNGCEARMLFVAATVHRTIELKGVRRIIP
jgi:hypothetical protein